MSQPHIAQAARGWVGTRFAHQGRVKKSANSRGGCDCIGLIIGVAGELGISCKGRKLADFDSLSYSRNPDGFSLKTALDEYLTPIKIAEAAVGDVLLLRINKDPQHVAFIGSYEGGGLSLIHSYIQARGVVEHTFDEYWQERVVGAYRL